MTKEEFISIVSKINSTGEDEFKALYNSPEKLWDRVIALNLVRAASDSLLCVSDLLISLGDIDNEYKLEYHKSDDKWWIMHTRVGSGEPLEQWLTNRALRI